MPSREETTAKAVQREVGRTATVAVNSVLLIEALVCAAYQPGMPCLLICAVAIGWSAFRLSSSRTTSSWLLGDAALVQAFVGAILAFASDQTAATGSVLIGTAIGTTLLATGFALTPQVSALVLTSALVTTAWGCQHLGITNPLGVFAIDLLPVQWIMAVGVRIMVFRVARLVDEAAAEADRARIELAVASRRRHFEREQWALLHDTAASTLLAVGLGGNLPPATVRRQAQRDLELLRDLPNPLTADSATDLVDALAEMSRDIHTVSFLRVEAPPDISAPLSHAVLSATREALTNVDRHAQARTVTIAVKASSVTISDDGVGVDRAASDTDGRRRHGITGSIIGRMLDAGGSATVVGTPNVGTVVTLSWPATPEPLVARVVSPTAAATARRLVHGYSYAVCAGTSMLIVSGAIFAMLHGNQVLHAPAMAAALLLVAATAIGAPVDRQRYGYWYALAAAAVAIAMTSLIPLADVVSPANWAAISMGWLVVLQLRAESSRVLTCAVIASWVLTAVAVLARTTDSTTLVILGYDTAGVLVVQLLAARFITRFRVAAEQTARFANERRQLILQTTSIEAIRQDHHARSSQLSKSIMPLLAGLAAGEMEPTDPQIQRRARAEATHLRRLFDGQPDYALERDLHSAISEAEVRGVAVSLELGGTLPVLDDEQRTQLLAAPHRALAASQSQARIIITATPEYVEVSVTADCRELDARQLQQLEVGSRERHLPVALLVQSVGNLVWLRGRLTLAHNKTHGTRRPERTLG